MKQLIILISLAIVSCGHTTVSWKEGESVDKRYSNFTTVSDDPAFVDDFNKFYSIINDKELPYYQKIGISYHTN